MGCDYTLCERIYACSEESFAGKQRRLQYSLFSIISITATPTVTVLVPSQRQG